MSSNLRKIVWLIIAIVVALAGAYILRQTPSSTPLVGGKAPVSSGAIDSSLYQAVVLNNGQLYFGKLTKIESQWPTLSDVFYLKEKPQAPQKAGEAPKQPLFDLIKLGTSEIHQPQDTMILNRDQILYVENLRADSNVIKFINQSKEKK